MRILLALLLMFAGAIYADTVSLSGPPSQAEAEAGTSTVARPWTAERVKESIAALESGGGGGGGGETFEASLPGNASSTIGQLSKANNSSGNPGGLKSTTSSGDPGINNAGPDPFLVMTTGTIDTAVLKIAHAAVSTGTFTSPAVARFDVYRVDYSTRTKLGEINFDITSAGTFNNLGGDNHAVYTATPSIAIVAGDTIGIEFVNVSGSNTTINALGGIFIKFEAN